MTSRPRPAAAVVARARRFATRAHEGQRRDHGPAYITHPEGVARILAEEFPGEVAPAFLAVAWLHDVLEDTPATLDELRTEFGAEIAAGVEALTKRKGEEFAAYAARLRAAGPEIMLVKSADRLHNLRDAVHADPAWAKEYAAKTRRFLLPLFTDAWFLARIEEALARVEE